MRNDMIVPINTMLDGENVTIWLPVTAILSRVNIYADVPIWQKFPHYWLFVRGTHRSLVDSLKRENNRSFDVFLIVILNRLLNKQSNLHFHQNFKYVCALAF